MKRQGLLTVVFLILAELSAPIILADNHSEWWGSWITINDGDRNGISISFWKNPNCKDPACIYYWRFQNNYPGLTELDCQLEITDAKGKQRNDTCAAGKLKPGLNTNGGWWTTSSIEPRVVFKALGTASKVPSPHNAEPTRDSVAGSSMTKHAFRPSISDIQLEPGCIELLKSESERLELAGATKKLLAWSPLITLVGENNAVHAAFFIHNTDWEQLAESLKAVDKLVLYRLATDARMHANSGAHVGNPKAKEFWNAMANFYASQAER